MTYQTLKLTIGDREGDLERTDELTQGLRTELLELEVAEIHFERAKEVPAGSKGDPITIGTLLLSLAASGGVLTTLINAIQSFLSRNDKRTVTLEGKDGDKVTITGNPSAEEKKLIAAWQKKNLKT
jgi:hypothetical protein